jgi:metal-responsive CopG/Arc/MetJ family transcriptional regulator
MRARPKKRRGEAEGRAGRIDIYVEPDLMMQLDVLRGLVARSAFVRQLIVDKIKEEAANGK